MPAAKVLFLIKREHTPLFTTMARFFIYNDRTLLNQPTARFLVHKHRTLSKQRSPCRHSVGAWQGLR